MAVAAVAALLVVGGMAGGAYASNGDPNGSNTGTEVSNIVPAGSDHSDPTLQDVAAQAEKDRVAINITWLMVGGILVLFMQAGFALVETGFTRAKNAAHTMMMNMVIFALGVVGWFVCGYALMFGATGASVIGLTPLGTAWHIGDWNVLAHSGFFLGGTAYDVSVMGFSSSSSCSWTPPRPSPRAQWPSAGSSARSACGVCSHRCCCTRSTATGSGVGAGCRSWVRSVRSGATAPSTSPDQASCMRWAGSPRSGERRSSARASGSSRKMAPLAPSPVITSPWRSSARSSSSSDGWASTAARRSPAPTSASPS